MISKKGKVDSFAMSKAGSCLYDAIKAKAEQDTAAFQRKLEQQAEALQQEIAWQERKAAWQEQKRKKAEERERREIEHEREVLERKISNAEEKSFDCPACGCSFKLTRGWFYNKDNCYEKGLLFMKPYKEHTCPYCKSIVRLDAGAKILRLHDYETMSHLKSRAKHSLLKLLTILLTIAMFLVLAGIVWGAVVGISILWDMILPHLVSVSNTAILTSAALMVFSLFAPLLNGDLRWKLELESQSGCPWSYIFLGVPFVAIVAFYSWHCRTWWFILGYVLYVLGVLLCCLGNHYTRKGDCEKGIWDVHYYRIAENFYELSGALFLLPAVASVIAIMFIPAVLASLF